MIGPITCSGALTLGGVCGVLSGSILPPRVKETLPLIFGIITISIGTTLIGKTATLHVVVLALIVSTFLRNGIAALPSPYCHLLLMLHKRFILQHSGFAELRLAGVSILIASDYCALGKKTCAKLRGRGP